MSAPVPALYDDEIAELRVPLPSDALAAEPWRFDFFDTMRRIERQFARQSLGIAGATPSRQLGVAPQGLPRIGDASSRAEEYVTLGQNPYFVFPASNLSDFTRAPNGRFDILVKYLGLLGPQGALPLSTTEETYAWLRDRDDAFPRFLDLFTHRFLQLFFRAWSDARPAAQHDRPNEDRFIAYVGSAVGIGSQPYRDLDSIADTGKLGYAGLLGAKAKSASRLRGAIRGLFHVEVEVEQFVGSRLELDPADRTLLGTAMSGLGVDTMLGATYYSVQDKIRIRIFVIDLAHYARFLPDGDLCEPLVDLVFFILGEELDWDVELAIPANAVLPARLGASSRLGWTSWLAPDLGADGYRSDARFHAVEGIRRKRERARQQAN